MVQLGQITPLMLCRYFTSLVSRSLFAEYHSGPEAKVGKELSQTWVSVRVPREDIGLGIEDFIDKYILPSVAPFLAKLISKNAGYCYDLHLVADRSNARHSFNGVSMRCVQTPFFSDPVLGDVYIPRCDWEKYQPQGYEFRFDILHSRRLGIELAAA